MSREPTVNGELTLCFVRLSADFRSRAMIRGLQARCGGDRSSPDYAVRREKAAIFCGCETHPATVAPAGSNRSSRGGNESAEAFGVEGRDRRLGEGAGRNE